MRCPSCSDVDARRQRLLPAVAMMGGAKCGPNKWLRGRGEQGMDLLMVRRACSGAYWIPLIQSLSLGVEDEVRWTWIRFP